MNQKERNKRNYIIIGLCAIVAIMAVGYAAFSSQLTINATSEVTSSWCVGFDSAKTNDYVPTAGIIGGTVPTGSIGFDGNVCDTSYKTVANLSASFKQPGDKIVYTLTIANRGSLNAAIKSIIVDGDSVTSNTTKTKGNITFRINMPESTSIAAGGTTTMTVEAKFQNERDITGPYAQGEEESIEVLINAEQDDGSGGMDITPGAFTGTIYRNSTNNVEIGDSIVTVSETKWVETDGTISQGAFETEALCQADIDANGYAQFGVYCEQRTITSGGIGDYTTNASTLNKNYYLKHDVVDDIITETYLCVVTDTEHCIKYVDYSTNSGVLKRIFGEENCINKGGMYECTYNDLLVRASSLSDSLVAEKIGDMTCIVKGNSGHC